jgi:hypothetical protein
MADAAVSCKPLVSWQAGATNKKADPRVGFFAGQ